MITRGRKIFCTVIAVTIKNHIVMLKAQHTLPPPPQQIIGITKCQSEYQVTGCRTFKASVVERRFPNFL